jgi:hypothetical protein
MKIVSNIKAPVFTPVEINITVESVEELQHLWAMFNCTTTGLLNNAYNYERIKEGVEYVQGNTSNVYDLFTIVDDALIANRAKN